MIQENLLEQVYEYKGFPCSFIHFEIYRVWSDLISKAIKYVFNELFV